MYFHFISFHISASMWYPLATNQIERVTVGTWHNINSLVGLFYLDRLPLYDVGTPVINPWVGGAHQP